MALMKCPECGTDVSDKAESCPKCAFPITKTSNLPSENKTESEKKPVIANTNAKWKHVSWITYLAIGLLFLLPFCDISCSGRKVLTLTGSTMVTGASITPAILGNDFGQSREIPANLYAILALTSIILGLIISLIVRDPNIISGLLGLACSGFLIVLQVTINQKLSELQIDLFSANYTVAYWIVLIGGIFIAIVNFSTADYKISAPSELIWYAVWAIIIFGIFSFIISQFDPTTPLKFRPVLSSANSESSLFSFGPSPKELEEKRIADSIRVGDSIAMVQAEQQRIIDSVAKAQGRSNANNQKSDEIIVNRIKQVIEDYYKYSRNYDDNGLRNIFSNPVERYFSQTNLTPAQISLDKKNYAQSFSLLNIDIDYNTLKINSNNDRDNFTVSYDIQIIVKNLNSGKKIKFFENISLKINSNYLIYYITEQINSKENIID